MEAFWTHRTKTGRVVYDRAPHAFRFKDATSIQTSLARSQEPAAFGEHLVTSLQMGMEDLFFMKGERFEAVKAGFRAAANAYRQIIPWMQNDIEIARFAANFLLENLELLDQLAAMPSS